MPPRTRRCRCEAVAHLTVQVIARLRTASLTLDTTDQESLLFVKHAWLDQFPVAALFFSADVDTPAPDTPFSSSVEEEDSPHHHCAADMTVRVAAAAIEHVAININFGRLVGQADLDLGSITWRGSLGDFLTTAAVMQSLSLRLHDGFLGLTANTELLSAGVLRDDCILLIVFNITVHDCILTTGLVVRKGVAAEPTTRLVRSHMQRCWAEAAYRRSPVLRVDLTDVGGTLQDLAVAVACQASARQARLYVTRDTVMSLHRITTRVTEAAVAHSRSLQERLKKAPTSATLSVAPARSASVSMIRQTSMTSTGFANRAPSVTTRALSDPPPPPRLVLPHAVVSGKIDISGHGIILVFFASSFKDAGCVTLRLHEYAATFEQLPDEASVFQVCYDVIVTDAQSLRLALRPGPAQGTAFALSRVACSGPEPSAATPDQWHERVTTRASANDILAMNECVYCVHLLLICIYV